MRKLAALCFILVSIHARADLLITQLLEIDGQSQTVTSKIKDNMVRTDVAAQLTSITDTGTGDFIMITHENKSYLKISAAQTKQLMDKMQGMHLANPTGQPAERPKLIATGKKEKVNDYDTEIYTAESPTTKYTYWVSKDYPNAAAVQLQMAKLQDSMENKINSNVNAIPDTSKLPGIALKTEMVSNGHTTTATLISVKETTIDPTDFQVPAGYTEKHIPGFNTAPDAASSAITPAPDATSGTSAPVSSPSSPAPQPPQ